MRITSVELTDQEASDILSTAIEGGSTYWADIEDRVRAGINHDGVSTGSYLSARFTDAEAEADGDEDPEHSDTVDIDTIKTGINNLLGGKVEVGDWVLGEISAGLLNDMDIDAGCADVIVQAGAFGSIVFG